MAPATITQSNTYLVGSGIFGGAGEVTLGTNQAATAGTAINDAIAALGSFGGTILIPAGTWTIDTPVLLSKTGIILRGQSAGQTLLQFDGSSVTTAIKMVDTTQRHCLFRDFRIESSSDGNGTAIDASYFTNSIITNVRVGNTGVAPNKGIVYGTNGFYNAIRDCRVQVKGAGSIGVNYPTAANSNLASNVRIFGDASTTGVLVTSHSIKLERIDCETTMLIGIDVAATGHSCLIDHPYLEAISTGVRVAAGVKSVHILGGFIADCPAGGANNIVNSSSAGELKVTQCRVQFNTFNL